ncbi:hypothetical protein BJX76DRAFT_352544 [Aspergillus varians]
MEVRKHTRNQNACDTCRNRRVKCRFTQGEEVCDGCRFLGVPCTSHRPRRKRGPPNRYSTFAYKPASVPPMSTAVPGVVPAAVASPVSPFPVDSPVYPPMLGVLGLLAPSNLIHGIISDWFDNIHPLAPILHRRRFLTRLLNGDTSNDPVFCGLVISLVCATCVTFRRKSFAEYHPITVERCIHLIQSHNLLPTDGPYSLDWCVAKYNLANVAMAHRGMSDPWTHRMLNETMTGSRYLLMYKLDEMALIHRELLKRLNCLLKIHMINLDLIGEPALGRHIIDRNPSSHPSPYTDSELDPSSSTSSAIPPGHSDNNTYVPGLISLFAIFHAWYTSQIDRFYLPAAQVLSTGLARIQASLDNLPPELRWRGGLSRPQTATPGHDVQIANIFVTSLYVRSNLLQQFSHPADNQEEHQSIVSDLLEVLHHLPQQILEANGYSLTPKLRDIGAAYLEALQVDLEGELVVIGDEAKGKLERLLMQMGVLDFRPDVVVGT